MSFALERPGASGDQGRLADRIELESVVARFPLPDFSAEYRLGTNWGYVEASGIVRSIKLDDQLVDSFDLSKSLVGWGFSLSSNWKPSQGNVVRVQAVYGEGIENYFNDAPVDVAPTINTGDPLRPVKARTLPVFGMTLYLDHTWNKMLSTAIGYSRVDITNSSLQTDLAFRDGQYATINLLATPAKNIMMGGEIQWARRHNFRDGFSFNDPKLQFGFRYNFGVKFENGTVAQK